MPKLFESAEDFTNLFILENGKQDDPEQQEKIIK
jgi:hypothetical protein